jgi:membrane protein YqaA with SNARE-associated domain
MSLSWSSQQNLTRERNLRSRYCWAVDISLLFILLAVVGTLLLFAAGVFAYPFGLVVLTLLALWRYLRIKGST